MANTEESRAGAIACLNAIRIIERLAKNPDPEVTMEDYWRGKAAAISAMLMAAGEKSEYLTGFIATFAEYVCMVEGGGIPDPYHWKPEAGMTNEEEAAYRASYEEAAPA